MNEKIIDLALNEYQREFDRKTRLDTKTIGYITFVSILIAASTGLFSIAYAGIENRIFKFVSIVLLFLEIYFSIWALVFALRAHKMRGMECFVINNILKYWGMKEDEQNGSILKTISEIVNENNKINNDIERENEITYMFLQITVICYILLSVWVLALLVGGQNV
jgi:hypothetical protein